MKNPRTDFALRQQLSEVFSRSLHIKSGAVDDLQPIPGIRQLTPEEIYFRERGLRQFFKAVGCQIRNLSGTLRLLPRPPSLPPQNRS